jgi:hypothetical protein
MLGTSLIASINPSWIFFKLRLGEVVAISSGATLPFFYGVFFHQVLLTHGLIGSY